MPVVAILPLWAFLYAGTLEPPKKTEPDAEGGGRRGVHRRRRVPAATAVPAAAAWARSCPAGRWRRRSRTPSTRSAGSSSPRRRRRGVRRRRQGREGRHARLRQTLSLTQIVEVTLHERQTLAGHDIAEDAEGWADLHQLVEEFPERGYTEEEVALILEEIAVQEGVEIPEPE
ncbi:MAG: hypothetical protein R2755_25265 [Acidimicrobiales bacterium]